MSTPTPAPTPETDAEFAVLQHALAVAEHSKHASTIEKILAAYSRRLERERQSQARVRELEADFTPEESVKAFCMAFEDTWPDAYTLKQTPEQLLTKEKSEFRLCQRYYVNLIKARDELAQSRREAGEGE
jgi:lipoate-protein ligase A